MKVANQQQTAPEGSKQAPSDPSKLMSLVVSSHCFMAIQYDFDSIRFVNEIADISDQDDWQLKRK